MMRRFLATAFLFYVFSLINAQQQVIHSDQIASLQVVAGNRWLDAPIIRLGGRENINISFDDFTHEYRRLTYSVTHCEEDWSPSEQLFVSDYISGFQSDNTIDDLQESLNTNQLYNHYQFSLPNEKCRLKISGNYQVDVIDDETGDTVITARFMVYEDGVSVSKILLTDTDIDVRKSHQQLNLRVDYSSNLQVNDPKEQFVVKVMQNNRLDNEVICPPAPILRQGVMEWTHCRDLIFPAGNEFHKFEILDIHRNSLGVDSIRWNGENYEVYLYHDYPRRAYVYDEDANGAFLLRNSDNYESEITSEYVNVHFYLDTPQLAGDVYIHGNWTTSKPDQDYLMDYDNEGKCYHIVLPLKYGYYSYEYLNFSDGEKSATRFTEGDFFETENGYLVLVYYRANGDRTWRLVGISE